MASRVAGEAKFSEAISLRLARWSASSAAMAVAISGAPSPATSMAAAKASASALTPLRSASGQTVRRYEARVESAFMVPLPDSGGGRQPASNPPSPPGEGGSETHDAPQVSYGARRLVAGFAGGVGRRPRRWSQVGLAPPVGVR